MRPEPTTARVRPRPQVEEVPHSDGECGWRGPLACGLRHSHRPSRLRRDTRARSRGRMGWRSGRTRQMKTATRTVVN